MKRTALLSFVTAGMLLASAGQAQVVFSRIYGGGGSGGSGPINRDFVELFNRGSSPVTLAQGAVVYSSATGSNWGQIVRIPASTTIPAGGYYLVELATGGSGGLGLPVTPDHIGGTTINISGTAAKIALVDEGTVTGITGYGGATSPTIPVGVTLLDWVGFGANANAREGTANAPSPTQSGMLERGANGCTDLNENSTDFTQVLVLAARNSASPTASCAGTNLSITVTDTPDPVTAPGTNIVYSVDLDNVGTSPVNGVTMTAVFPVGVTFISCSIPGFTFNNGTRTLTVPLGNLTGAQNNAPFDVVVQPTVAFPASSPLNVTFTANPVAGDSQPSNNTAIASTVVQEIADLSASITAATSCELIQNAAESYTVTLQNLGTVSATNSVASIVLSPNSTFVSSVPAGTYDNATRTLSVNVGNIAASGSANVTVNTIATGIGGVRTTVTGSTTASDLVTTNNTAFTQQVVNGTNTPITAILSTAAGAPNAQVTENDQGFELARNLTNLNRPWRSLSGSKMVMRVDVDTGDTNTNTGLLVLDTAAATGSSNPRLIVRERSTPVDSANPNNQVNAGSFSNTIGINDSGAVAVAVTLRDSVAAGNPTARALMKVTGPATAPVFSFVGKQNEFLGATLDTLWGSTNGRWSTFHSPTIQNDGTTSFYTVVSGSGIINSGVTANDRAFVENDGQAFILRRNAFVPNSQAGGTTFPVSFLDDDTSGVGRGLRTNAAGTRFLATGSLASGDTTNDEVVIQDGNVIIQEGQPIVGMTQPAGASPSGTPFSFVTMEPDGTTFTYGSTAPVLPSTNGQDFVQRNGNVVARTGDAITASSTERWSDTALASTFIGAAGNGNDYVVAGLTDKGDNASDSVIVHNGSSVVLRERQAVALGDGSTRYVSFIENDSMFIGADRKLYVVVRVQDNDDVCVPPTGFLPEALLAIDLPAGGCSPADVGGQGGTVGSDGRLDNNDFAVFITLFFAGDARADVGTQGGGIGGDGQFNNNDFAAFITLFFQDLPNCQN